MQSTHTTTTFMFIAIAMCGCVGNTTHPAAAPTAPQPLAIRVATFNLEDVGTADVRSSTSPRLKAAAAVIQELRPDIILLNEIAYDQPDGPGHMDGNQQGRMGNTLLTIICGSRKAKDWSHLPIAHLWPRATRESAADLI